MKIALIGTGLMGYPMAERLMANGKEIVVYNRTKEKAEPLAAKGAEIASSPEEAINKTDIIITMLADYNAVSSVLGNIKDFSDKTLIQMSTIATGESLLIKDKIEKSGGVFCEAPVLGSTPQAEAGELLVIFGGSNEEYEKQKELLDIFAKKVFYVGDASKAAAVKLALNQLIASLASAFSASLGFILEKGVDADTFMDILRNSPLYAKAFDSKLPHYKKRDFSDVHFPVKHLLKDINLVLGDFKAEGLFVPNIEGVEKILKEAIEIGESENDYSALYNAVHKKEK